MGITERKEREREQRRNLIIDAAERIFFKKGIDNSTMDDVAAEAELSKGTLYLYFKSKEDIQLAIAMRGSDILKGMMQKRLSENKTGYENLMELADISIDFSGTSINIIMNSSCSSRAQDFEQLNLEESRIIKYLTEQSPLAIVQECVKKGIADKSLRTDIPADIFAATLWSQLLGVLIVINYKKNIYRVFGLDGEDIIRTHLDLVSNGGRRTLTNTCHSEEAKRLRKLEIE